MRRLTTVLAATCAAVLLTSAGTFAQGIVDSRLTNVTFSGPVEIPGKTLPAGTYQFRLMDSASNRNIVQVFDKDGSQLIATMLAIAAERPQPEGEPVITFKETRADQPPAVHFWYYAGEKSGSELVYPKSQAMTIARASGEPVMSTDTESTEANALKNSKVSRVTPTDTTAPSTQPDTTTAPQQPTSQPPTTPVTTAPTTPTTTAPTTTPYSNPPMQPQGTQPQGQTEQPVGTSGRTSSGKLPHTASPLPTIGLIGLLSLVAAFGIRAMRRRVV
jgi:hypothetical protein